MSEAITAPSNSEAVPITSRSSPPPSDAAYGFSPAIVSLLSEGGPQADAIRVLRTHLMAQHINHGRRALAVCGPSAGVGCSFIAANVAVALSQIGVKTLLIDGDLRRPAIDRLIRPPSAPGGLVQALKSPDVAFRASINSDILPNFSIMYAGQAASNPQELLASERFDVLMKYCLREYDVTIVDTPPANTSSDARRISGVVGYSLIVTARDKTFVKDVKTLCGQLKTDRTVVIGTILNRV